MDPGSLIACSAYFRDIAIAFHVDGETKATFFVRLIVALAAVEGAGVNKRLAMK
jgi:hypothetical protein